MPPKYNSRSLVIGLDISTTSTKIVAVNESGKIFANAKRPLSLISSHPGYYEQKPEDWWRATCNSLKEITKRVNPRNIKALAVSNQRETFVALDSKGIKLRNAIIWLDERCKDEVEPFAEKIGKNKIHRITGKPVDYAPVVYRLAWMKKYEPHLYKRIAKVCDVQSYLVWKLTGAFSTSRASADPTGIFDIKNNKWSCEILRALNLDYSNMPEPFQPGSVLGKISEAAAEQTGLLAGTLIAAGGGDGQAAALGSDTLIKKRAYVNVGTAVVAGVYSEKYKTSRTFRTLTACAEKGFIFESSLRSGTLALDWFIQNILSIDSSAQPGVYKKLTGEAQNISEGSNGLLFLPYLNGVMNPYWDIRARGVLIGLLSSHKRGHIFRSIMEGIAYETLLAVNMIEKKTGMRINELVIIGGGASNRLWCRIFADVTNRNICLLKNPEASGLGAAICAAIGAGWFKYFQEAADAMCGITEIIKPDSGRNKIYKRYYTAYKKIYDSTIPINSILSDVN
ncbi:MAG: hypothetical protein JW995_15275 [Melioribacteraceae bacterium]|nr:hypothetical protein [Melioribacteraceae bacterium]